MRRVLFIPRIGVRFHCLSCLPRSRGSDATDTALDRLAHQERRATRLSVERPLHRRHRGALALGPASRRGSADDRVVKGLIVTRSGQYVFKEIVEHYLKQISFGEDNLAAMIRLPQYGEANVVLDPYRGYGQPVFSTSGANVSDALGPLRAGETFESVAEDYGVSEAELRDALDAIAA
jgi:uncharacterized protein (DUF433 family)